MDTFVVVTTSRNPEGEASIELCKELEEIIPYSQYFPSHQERPEHTLLVKVVENAKMPLYIRVTDTCGNEVEFKIINYKSKKYLRNKSIITPDVPQLVVHNFNTSLGDQVVNWLARLFPSRIEGRQVVSFHCKNDFIFFRYHRYIFRENRVDFQDIGPHMTLRLKRLRSNTEIIYEYKKYEKRVFVL